jgi:hypothetical protein
MRNPSIALLPELIAVLPDELRAVADDLLFVERVYGRPVPPPPMHDWIQQRFGSLEQVAEQTIVKVTNRWSLEAAYYNPLRARRPLGDDDVNARKNRATDADQELEALISAGAGPHDMFGDPFNQTTADLFGRIQGRYCVSASNVAKCDAWHGLVIFDEFHPLRFNQEQVRDYFDVALRWLGAAHTADAGARYPLILWNCLWRAGASITHGHLQTMLAHGMAPGQIERWRRAAVAYRTRHERNLMADLGQLHDALGLTFRQRDGVHGYVTLTPIRDRELLLTTSNLPRVDDWSTLDHAVVQAALEPLWDATWAALRGLIDAEGVRSFNVVVYLPPCGRTAEPWDELPVCVRIVDRGNPLTRMVNFGAMELFASSVIAVDPFTVAAALRGAPSQQS